jgi:hypothetical protein
MFTEAVVSGQMVPEGLSGMARGQPKPDAVPELPDPAADLEQVQSQGVQLRRWGGQRHQPAAQRVQQPVGGGMQHQPKLVGPEAMIAEVIGATGDF